MKTNTIYATGDTKQNHVVDEFISSFENIKIPIHKMWKRPPKIVIQALLRQAIMHSMISKYSDSKWTTDAHQLPKRQNSTLKESLTGEDRNNSPFIMLPSFVHESGTEKILVALQSMYAQHRIDYAVLFVCGEELKGITDGIIFTEKISETIESYRGIFTLPLYIVEILPADFFDLQTYRHDPKFWRPYTNTQNKFNQLLVDHPALVRSLGLD
jgi:hypothetical protein